MANTKNDRFAKINEIEKQLQKRAVFEVNLQTFAEQAGWLPRKDKSTPKYPAYHRAGDKKDWVKIWQGERDGAWMWQNIKEGGKAQKIVDFLVYNRGISVSQALGDVVGIMKGQTGFTFKENYVAPEKKAPEPIKVFDAPGEAVNFEYFNTRGISEDVYTADIFKGTFGSDDYKVKSKLHDKNVVFPIVDIKGRVRGLSRRNVYTQSALDYIFDKRQKDAVKANEPLLSSDELVVEKNKTRVYKQFASGSKKTEALWISNIPSDPKYIMMCEQPFDAMAYYQLHKDNPKLKHMIFASPGGSFSFNNSDSNIHIANAIIKKYDLTAVLANDKDITGRLFNLKMLGKELKLPTKGEVTYEFGGSKGMINIEVKHPIMNEANRVKLTNIIKSKSFDGVVKIGSTSTALATFSVPYTENNYKLLEDLVIKTRGISNVSVHTAPNSKDWNDELLGKFANPEEYSIPLSEKLVEPGVSFVSPIVSVVHDRVYHNTSYIGYYEKESGTVVYKLGYNAPDDVNAEVDRFVQLSSGHDLTDGVLKDIVLAGLKAEGGNVYLGDELVATYNNKAVTPVENNNLTKSQLSKLAVITSNIEAGADPNELVNIQGKSVFYNSVVVANIVDGKAIQVEGQPKYIDAQLSELNEHLFRNYNEEEVLLSDFTFKKEGVFYKNSVLGKIEDGVFVATNVGNITEGVWDKLELLEEHGVDGFHALQVADASIKVDFENKIFFQGDEVGELVNSEIVIDALKLQNTDFFDSVDILGIDDTIKYLNEENVLTLIKQRAGQEKDSAVVAEVAEQVEKEVKEVEEIVAEQAEEDIKEIEETVAEQVEEVKEIEETVAEQVEEDIKEVEETVAENEHDERLSNLEREFAEEESREIEALETVAKQTEEKEVDKIVGRTLPSESKTEKVDRDINDEYYMSVYRDITQEDNKILFDKNEVIGVFNNKNRTLVCPSSEFPLEVDVILKQIAVKQGFDFRVYDSLENDVENINKMQFGVVADVAFVKGTAFPKSYVKAFEANNHDNFSLNGDKMTFTYMQRGDQEPITIDFENGKFNQKEGIKDAVWTSRVMDTQMTELIYCENPLQAVTYVVNEHERLFNRSDYMFVSCDKSQIEYASLLSKLYTPDNITIISNESSNTVWLDSMTKALEERGVAVEINSVTSEDLNYSIEERIDDCLELSAIDSYNEIFSSSSENVSTDIDGGVFYKYYQYKDDRFIPAGAEKSSYEGEVDNSYVKPRSFFIDKFPEKEGNTLIVASDIQEALAYETTNGLKDNETLISAKKGVWGQLDNLVERYAVKEIVALSEDVLNMANEHLEVPARIIKPLADPCFLIKLENDTRLIEESLDRKENTTHVVVSKDVMSSSSYKEEAVISLEKQHNEEHAKSK